MTALPDWLVERAALDEVAPVSRERVDRADPRELADRIAALRADNAAELAAHPPAPAVVQIEARVAAARKRRTQRRFALVGSVMAAATIVIVLFAMNRTTRERVAGVDEDEVTRPKGATRLLAFRFAGDHAERLEQDAVVRAGDVIQLRYHAGRQRWGVIASLDGAGVVTLHYPTREDAPPEATALAPKTTALPNAYALDDAPHFERFFFITSEVPVDVAQSLAAIRALARRSDAATGSLELPAELHQWSLRLRKKAPTP